MCPGTAKAQCALRTIFSVIFINQIASFFNNQLDIQILLQIFPPDYRQTGVIHAIIDSIIMKRHQHSLINCILQRDFKRDIIIAYFINIPAIHPVGGRGQP